MFFSRGKYLRRNPVFNIFLFCIDGLLALVLKRQFAQEAITTPNRILLANGAHLGDVVMSTSVLPVLKSAYPSAKFGFVVGSWSKPIVDGNPLVDFVHIVDHWRLNREEASFTQKLSRYWTTRANALSEIKATNYDLAIDLYTCFPNMIPLLWQAKIPVRIGYTGSGFGPMLSHGAIFTEQVKHETKYQSDLLRILPITNEHFKKQHSVLPIPGNEAKNEVAKLLGVASLQDVKYQVIHMGTGLPAKEWPTESWQTLAEKLIKTNNLLLFTGVGERENANIDHTIAGLSECINACNKLSWLGYLAAVSHAELLYCTDSLAGHVAAALETNCVVVYSGITDPIRWRPESDGCVVITNPMPCAPCNQKQGCEHMQCIRGISPDQIYQAGKSLLARVEPQDSK